VIGRTLKNYAVEELLGRGGMGEVYRARDTRLGRPVALKVLRAELTRDDTRRRRFVQEARAASAVNHPAIAQIYDIDDDGETTFIAMEFVDGSTVRQLVAKGDLDLPSAVEIGIQVGDALARAHQAGIVHRDIKSDNVMVTRDGHPKILDFGLAKLVEDGSGETDGSLSRLETVMRTQAGMIVGTVAYMSPEQARGLPTDRRSDIFSFGVLLYEMAAGKVPFEGASMLDTLHAIAYEPMQPITAHRGNLPYSLQRVVDRCLQKKPEDRYQEIRETVTDLRAVKKDIDSGVSRGMPLADRVRFWVSGITPRGMVWAAAGSVAGAALLYLLLDRGQLDLGSLLLMAFVGALIYRRIRNRGHRLMRRFVKKAASLKEVRVVRFHQGEFTVLADRPTPKTYLKLNAQLAAVNEKLFRGEPMTLTIRETGGDEEVRKTLASPGVQFVREPRR
jgi:predicted Ser/Thr protein kinase